MGQIVLMPPKRLLAIMYLQITMPLPAMELHTSIVNFQFQTYNDEKHFDVADNTVDLQEAKHKVEDGVGRAQHCDQ